MAADDKAERRRRLVEICTALPEAAAYGERHIGFKVRRRTFAYYLDDHHGVGRIVVSCKVGPGDQETLIDLDPDRFHMPAYLGARGWISLRLDLADVDWNEVAQLVKGSYRLVAPARLAAGAG